MGKSSSNRAQPAPAPAPAAVAAPVPPTEMEPMEPGGTSYNQPQPATQTIQPAPATTQIGPRKPGTQIGKRKPGTQVGPRKRKSKYKRGKGLLAEGDPDVVGFGLSEGPSTPGDTAWSG